MRMQAFKASDECLTAGRCNVDHPNKNEQGL